jgi:aldehyde dehydrogenase (NAD+)
MRFSCGASPEGRSRVTLRGSYGLFIGGAFVSGSSVFKTISPATEEVLAEVTHGVTEDVDRAVAAARHAYERVWSVMPGRERARYLLRIARLIRERAGELAVLESLDSGKPIRQTRDVDLPLATAHFFYHAGWADKLAYAGFGANAGTNGGTNAGANASTPVRPLGVVGQVIGWSSPLLMLVWKIAPALACGNTVVLKPAETTPLTALAFAEICADAGLPPGVVNIVTGDGLTGQLVAGHPGIDKVAFTGSPEVGKEIAKSAALWGKRLTLELGGTSANIVCADADIEAAAQGIVEGVFVRQGHACCASSRVFVQEAVLDDLVDAVRRRMAVLRPGDPLDEGTDIGAVNSAGQLDKITELARSAEAEGAVRWSAPCALLDRGFWFPPTMFTTVSEEHRIARDELCWPVLSVSSFGTPEEVIERTNSTRYGLSAGVWTRQGALSARLSARLRAGVVWVNSFGRLDPAVPFGGFQESGLGRQGGRHGLEAYLDLPGTGTADV